MRLLKVVDRLEAARAAEPDLRANCLMVTTRDDRIDATSLAPGEFIAADVVLLSNPDDVVFEAHISERVTRDRNDLGAVLDVNRERVGRVIRIDGSLMELQIPEESAAAAAPVRPKARACGAAAPAPRRRRPAAG